MATRTPAQKRPLQAPSRKQHQLPPRQLCFKRHLAMSMEDRLCEAIGEALEASGKLSLVVGRLLGADTKKEIVLPLATEALLEGPGYVFEPELSPEAGGAIQAALVASLQAWKGAPAERRWAEVSRAEQVRGRVQVPQRVLTVYCPGSSWHYQLQLGMKESQAQETVEERFLFKKDEGDGGALWTVSRSRTAGSAPGTAGVVSLRVNEKLLLDHWQRKKQQKQHNFPALCRDFLRNARALVGVLKGEADTRVCYFPGLLDAVAEHYSQKARPGGSLAAYRASLTSRLRKHNNLVKVLLIEGFVDSLKGPVRVLDLGCGRGQDVGKFSRSHRTCDMALYVGVDFAQAAIEEAKRRHAELVKAAEIVGRAEYEGAFYAGDCLGASVWEKFMKDGHQQFDVISMQFMLQYLTESALPVKQLLERCFSLLRPGGVLLASSPECEALSGLYLSAEGQAERKTGNKLFQIHFHGPAWQGVAQEAAKAGPPDLVEEQVRDLFASRWGLRYSFSLIDAVEGQDEFVVPWKSLEALIVDVGFEVVTDCHFPEITEHMCKTSRYYQSTFKDDPGNTDLNEEEREVFELYSCFVLKRPEG